jgi:hypothetical protein
MCVSDIKENIPSVQVKIIQVHGGSELSRPLRPQMEKLVPDIPLMSTYDCNRLSLPILRKKQAQVLCCDVVMGIKIPGTHFRY